MKKLHTIGQMIDMQEDYISEMIKEAPSLDLLSRFFNKVSSWNVLLKKEIKGEMFWNPFEKPEQEELKGDSLAYDEQYKEWEEAEKKVIFENVIVEPVGDVWRIGKYWMQSEKNGAIFLLDNETKEWIPIKTLHNLAEITNGEIELKNVEI
jgi:hypothetical protein